jgi:hypothetical protein
MKKKDIKYTSVLLQPIYDLFYIFRLKPDQRIPFCMPQKRRFPREDIRIRERFPKEERYYEDPYYKKESKIYT